MTTTTTETVDHAAEQAEAHAAIIDGLAGVLDEKVDAAMANWGFNNSPPPPAPNGRAGAGPKLHPLATQARTAAADVLDFVVHSRPVSGATAELQADQGLGANVIPLDVLIAEGLSAMPSAAASSVTSGGDARMQERTREQVFPTPLSMAFGVDRQTVGVGIAAVPVVTAPDSGPDSTTDIGTSASSSTVTITGTELTPKRLQISATVGKDELSTFQGLVGDVGMVLRQAIESAIDRQVLYAAGDNGILNHGSDPNAGSTVEDFASFIADVTNAVDGRYAARASDLSALFGPQSYQLAARSYRSNESDMTAIAALEEMGVDVMTSANVAAASSDNQDAVVCRGGRMHQGVVQRIWPGAEVLVDPFTLSDDGQVKLTLCVMMDTAVTRSDMYVRRAFHLA